MDAECLMEIGNTPHLPITTMLLVLKRDAVDAWKLVPTQQLLGFMTGWRPNNKSLAIKM